MLAKSQPNLLDIDNDSDIYDGASSLRSGTSSNTLNEDEPEKENRGKHKVNVCTVNLFVLFNWIIDYDRCL